MIQYLQKEKLHMVHWYENLTTLTWVKHQDSATGGEASKKNIVINKKGYLRYTEINLSLHRFYFFTNVCMCKFFLEGYF